MRTIEEDLEELRESEDPDKDDDHSDISLKKFIVILSSLFIAILISSYFLFGGLSFGASSSMIRSDKVSDSILSTHGFDVVFEGNTLQRSKKVWNENPDVESPLCFHGERSGSVYRVDFAYEPDIIDQSYTNIRHESCDEDTIILFHTHPYKRCIASQADMTTLRNAQRRNPDIAMLIMCDENRFSLYH